MSTWSKNQRLFFDYISRLLSVFLVFPVLFLCAGYLYNVGYFSALGAPWLVQDLDRASIIEKGLFPLTSFFVSFTIPIVLIKAFPKIKAWSTKGIYICTYGLVLTYIASFFGYELHVSQMRLEFAYSLWSLLISFFCLAIYYRIKLKIDFFSLYLSYLTVVFGFLALNELYGFRAGWSVLNDRLYLANSVILKEHNHKEPLVLLSVKTSTIYALDLNTTMTYSANSTTYTKFITSVIPLEVKDIGLIIPASCNPRARLDAPETPFGIIDTIRKIDN